MVFKKTFLENLFRVKVVCYAVNCNHVFEDGDDYEVEDLLFAGNVFVCKTCHDEFLKKIETDKQRHKQIELDKKRSDYKILAEEIVKLMK